MKRQSTDPRPFCANTDDGTAFKTADAASYDSVTASFDKFTRRFNAPLAERLLDLCEPLRDKKILDLGTGTGVVALAAGRRSAPKGRVIGLDLSAGMLRLAEENARAYGLDAAVSFIQGDAEQLDLPDESFDAVVGLFSLFHFPDRPAVLREVVRVLRRGGIACFGVGSAPPPTSLLGWVSRLQRLPELLISRRGRWLNAPNALDQLVAEIIPPSSEAEVAAETARPHGYGPETVSLLRAAGLRSIKTTWMGLRERLENAEEFWEVQATYSTFARKRLATATFEQRQQVRRLHDEKVRAVLARGGVLSYPHAAFFAAGRKPEIPA